MAKQERNLLQPEENVYQNLNTLRLDENQEKLLQVDGR